MQQRKFAMQLLMWNNSTFMWHDYDYVEKKQQ